MKIVVIGAGLIGLTSALALARAGHELWILDRSSQPGLGASGQNGAQLSYAYVAPLANPDTLKALPTLLFSAQSPLKLKLSLDPAVLSWFWQFARACTATQARRTTQALYELSHLSRNGIHQFLADLLPAQRAATGHASNGKLVLYHSEAKMRSARAQLALMNGLGAQQSLLNKAQCLAQEPALTNAKTNFVGGVYTPGEEVIDGLSLCNALIAQLQQTGRCHFLWNTQVQHFEMTGGAGPVRRVDAVTYQNGQLSGDAFVIANGSDAASLGAGWGLSLPVQPMRGYSIQVPQSCVGAWPKVSVTESSLHTVFAPLNLPEGNGLRVAGMAEMMGHALVLDSAKIEILKQSVRSVFGLNDELLSLADIKPWVGLRPVTPSALPVIGRAPQIENGFVNVGQGALGLTLSFGSAQILANIMAGNATPIDAAPYKP
jgi:D-amino-acid dehydrogenase